MKRSLPKILLIMPVVLGVALAALLGGCGGGTQTTTVASTPLPEGKTAETTTATPRTSTTTTTTPASTPTSTTPAPGGTSSPTTTRTAGAPAFTHEAGAGTSTTTSTAEGLSGAEAVLRAQGYTASATSDYHPDQTLRVLVGTHAGSAAGSGQQAFFFVGNHYIGTDSKQPSAQVHVVSQSDTEVALAYALSGGAQATVRFQLNNGKLVPLGQIPPASSRQ